MNKKPIQWANITTTRRIMLSQSDWSQLPDSGLSRECIIQWRNWRRELRTITEDNYNNILTAVAELTKMDESKPESEYSDAPTFLQEKHIISHVDLKREIVNLIEKLHPVEPHTEPPKSITFDAITNVKVGRKFAQSEAEKAYKEKIKEKSPAIETFVLYTERLNQSIDFLSRSGENFPLLELLAESLDETVEEVANTILKTHSHTISNFIRIEREYIKVLKMIRESDNIGDMKTLVECFNGY